MTDQRPKNRVYNAVLWRDAVAVLDANNFIQPHALAEKIRCDDKLAAKMIMWWREQKRKNEQTA